MEVCDENGDALDLCPSLRRGEEPSRTLLHGVNAMIAWAAVPLALDRGDRGHPRRGSAASKSHDPWRDAALFPVLSELMAAFGYHRVMGHMSNRERIARAAQEAQIASAEKAAKKVTKIASGSSPRRAAKPVRMKIVWEVCTGAGAVVKTFLYPDKAAAEAATEALTKSKGQTHILRAAKVPME